MADISSFLNKMDKETIDTLFRQNLSTIKSFVELLFDSLNKDVKQLRLDNTELRRSLEYTQSEVEELKTSLKQQRDNCPCLSQGHTTKGEVGAILEDHSERLRGLEDYSRRNNLRLDNFDEPSDESQETLHHRVNRVFKEKLQTNAELEVVHRTGTHVGDRPRSVLIKFKSYRDRQTCFKAAPKLKGTNLYLNEDVSKATMEIRKGKMEELREKRSRGLIAYFSGSRLVTKNRSRQDHVNDLASVMSSQESESYSTGSSNRPSTANTSTEVARDAPNGQADTSGARTRSRAGQVKSNEPSYTSTGRGRGNHNRR